MAKNQLPSIDDSVKQTDKPKEQAAAGPVSDWSGNGSNPRKDVEDAPGTVADVAAEGYIPRRVEARLTRAQARILRDKQRELQDIGARTADGRFVDNRARTIQYMIEKEGEK